MMARQFNAATLLSTAACVLLSGCAGADRPATYPVRGKVTYRGEPVAGASVAFLAPGAPRPAVGTTDAQGNFQLTTFESNDGAIPGMHVVTVRKLALQAGPSYTLPAGNQPDPAAIEQAMQEAAQRLERAEKSGSELPAKYGAHRTSDLRCEVKAGENYCELTLVDGE
jgi:hypothetical protein